jgi:hypothetical protein
VRKGVVTEWPGPQREVGQERSGDRQPECEEPPGQHPEQRDATRGAEREQHRHQDALDDAQATRRDRQQREQVDQAVRRHQAGHVRGEPERPQADIQAQRVGREVAQRPADAVQQRTPLHRQAAEPSDHAATECLDRLRSQQWQVSRGGPGHPDRPIREHPQRDDHNDHERERHCRHHGCRRKVGMAPRLTQGEHEAGGELRDQHAGRDRGGDRRGGHCVPGTDPGPPQQPEPHGGSGRTSPWDDVTEPVAGQVDARDGAIRRRPGRPEHREGQPAVAEQRHRFEHEGHHQAPKRTGPGREPGLAGAGELGNDEVLEEPDRGQNPADAPEPCPSAARPRALGHVRFGIPRDLGPCRRPGQSGFMAWRRQAAAGIAHHGRAPGAAPVPPGASHGFLSRA